MTGSMVYLLTTHRIPFPRHQNHHLCQSVLNNNHGAIDASTSDGLTGVYVAFTDSTFSFLQDSMSTPASRVTDGGSIVDAISDDWLIGASVTCAASTSSSPSYLQSVSISIFADADDTVDAPSTDGIIASIVKDADDTVDAPYSDWLIGASVACTVSVSSCSSDLLSLSSVSIVADGNATVDALTPDRSPPAGPGL
ncbi:hypothetical protein CHS0354_013884 [Potamilus streckersoni]|uniref:Uncharacterized protein n=1 Tax=Potamilus streckersoni TaxID=2493646 RepID=A0AAE0SFX1_9BIVA|nr:hypothetical protein CHS0354_013884 [Potamilus streckersoni]